jgi:hypothetical protein
MSSAVFRSRKRKSNAGWARARDSRSGRVGGNSGRFSSRGVVWKGSAREAMGQVEVGQIGVMLRFSWT